ncbi:hypothetical protein GR173_004068 [Salmonella enterica subsp. enterica]|nr:hypothetical protein [Salmonella enterica subsp. enterica serovar Bareilly]ECB0725492.1 hypothetical protein [Salmonella enterica subsp. enterica serovar Noya]ECB3741788.1 hypothetical protein [Salmonella enterica subsp. enterica serovar Akanji]EDU0170861.1 hypothetical protein [Salmonella enterica subsp. enterica serovar Belfast]EDX9681041.1 hypothetical protein [Salmonella enterica subsp. enterica serovar Belfast]
MLFAYTYVPHQMERMQRFINFIFYQVWCRARKLDGYDLTLFDANPPLKEIMLSFAYDHTAAGDRFSSQVQSIFQSFSQLSREQIAQFKRWYQGNNNLEKVCANVPNAQLVRYADIAVNHKELSEQLGTFFKGLYSQSLLDLAALRAKIGDIDDHYKNFVQINKVGKCPFCGISDLLSEYHTKREAYDHYLPKALYPFNSINFRNLVPACHYCNSSYKTSKNPAYTPKDPAGAVRRRAVFYPYQPVTHAIELQVTLQTSDIENLAPNDIALQFGPDAVAEEIDTWKDIYGIEERYKAKLCGENDGKYWLTQVLDEWREDGRNPSDFLTALARQTRTRPYADCNFLRKPFLEACEAVGLLTDGR